MIAYGRERAKYLVENTVYQSAFDSADYYLKNRDHSLIARIYQKEYRTQEREEAVLGALRGESGLLTENPVDILYIGGKFAGFLYQTWSGESAQKGSGEQETSDGSDAGTGMRTDMYTDGSANLHTDTGLYTHTSLRTHKDLRTEAGEIGERVERRMPREPVFFVINAVAAVLLGIFSWKVTYIVFSYVLIHQVKEFTARYTMLAMMDGTILVLSCVVGILLFNWKFSYLYTSNRIVYIILDVLAALFLPILVMGTVTVLVAFAKMVWDILVVVLPVAIVIGILIWLVRMWIRKY